MNVLVFDTETTGLPSHPDTPIAEQPRIIEFGAVLVDEDGEELASESILINPGQPLEPVITKLTGLTDADLEGAPSFSGVYPIIVDLFARADVMIAHNLPFDRFMVELEIDRLGSGPFPWPPLAVCTAQENESLWGRRPKMLELYQHVLGRPLDQTHRALDDVRALVEIVRNDGTLERLAYAAAAASV